MSEPYLIVDDNDSRGNFRISWYFPDAEEIGGCIGDFEYSESDLRMATACGNTDSLDSIIAYIAAAKSPNVLKDSIGFYWETKSAAKSALSVIKAALKAGTDRPLPEWAKQALAAGWKAPKGWKP